ncbi:MAG: hypothetical protein F6K19_49685 [Cyanothece sp. SIO1E1]|nr:hypothetical protein [Cyanothece sp. SIO1E1]
MVPFLARLPERWTPFGSDRIPAQVGWAKSQHLSLFPPPLDLAALEQTQAEILRTWFVAHVDIKPHRGVKRQARQQPIDDETIQL